jgi:hypothetical protein
MRLAWWMADGGTATKKTRRKSREGRFSDATVATYYGDSRFSFNLPLRNGLWFGLWCDVTDGHRPAEDSASVENRTEEDGC